MNENETVKAEARDAEALALAAVLATLERLAPMRNGFDDAMVVIRDHAAQHPQHAQQAFEKIEFLWSPEGAHQATPFWDAGLAAVGCTNGVWYRYRDPAVQRSRRIRALL